MIKCPPERRFNLSAVDGQTETISPSHRHAPGRLIDLLLLVFPGTSNLTFFSLFTPVWNNNKHDHGALCRRDTFQDYFMEKKKKFCRRNQIRTPRIPNQWHHVFRPSEMWDWCRRIDSSQMAVRVHKSRTHRMNIWFLSDWWKMRCDKALRDGTLFCVTARGFVAAGPDV